MDSFSSLHGMEVAYQRDQEVATRSQPWKPLLKCMVQNIIYQFSYLHNPSWNTPTPEQPFQHQYNPHL